MKKENQTLETINLVGIKVRTNNLSELNPVTAKILPTIQRFFLEGISQKINKKKDEYKTFCVYAEYESDHMGDYTYFIGQEVETFDSIPDGLSTLSIPKQSYVKFTTNEGAMPLVCIAAWQKIWQMTPDDFGMPRSYVADFEVYDQRAADPMKTVLDIFIGLKP
ncbi:MAG: hypothetical protein HEEMFOPI_00020 [Holosporales bacterium]